MEALVSRYPDQANDAMREAAKEWKQSCNDKFPAYYSKGVKPFPKNWKSTAEYTNLGLIGTLTVSNKAPHFHLVEEGHAKWLWGKNTGGYVPGKFYAERTRAEFESRYPEIMEKALNDAVAGSGL